MKKEEENLLTIFAALLKKSNQGVFVNCETGIPNSHKLTPLHILEIGKDQSQELMAGESWSVSPEKLTGMRTFCSRSLKRLTTSRFNPHRALFVKTWDDSNLLGAVGCCTGVALYIPSKYLKSRGAIFVAATNLESPIQAAGLIMTSLMLAEEFKLQGAAYLNRVRGSNQIAPEFVKKVEEEIQSMLIGYPEGATLLTESQQRSAA